MARTAKPWYWKARKAWYVTIDGARHKLGAKRDEAFRRFHELMARPRRRTIACDSVPAILDAFVDWVEKHRAPDTFRWYKDRLQLFVESIPSDMKVSELRPFHVQEFVDAMPHKSGTKRNYVRAVKRAMKWAEEQGYIDRSPIAHMKKPSGGKREVIVTDDEYQQILEHTRDREFRDLCEFAWESGARASECFELEARHLDPANRRIVFPVAEEKMGGIPRVIYLEDKAFAIVQRFARKYPRGLLFRNTKGVPWTADSSSCRFRTLTKKIGKKFCLTDFRHTWINRLLMAGVDGITVAILAGHSDVSTISRVYQHLSMSPDYLRNQLKRA